MTRINCIPPEELTDKHLIAEYRELPRVFALARECDDAPDTYVLGAGHVKFFYDKLWFLYRRQRKIINEMKNRGFKPQYSADGLFRKWTFRTSIDLWNDWEPTPEAMEINRQRINERLGS